MIQKIGGTLRKIFFSVGEKGLIVMAVVMLGVVGMTVVDIVLRRVFNAPLGFTYEIVSLSLIVLVWGSILYSTGQERHISVDVIMSHVPAGFKRIMMLVWDAVTVIVMFLIGWRSILYAIRLVKNNTVSSMLDIPQYPFVIVVAFGAIWAGMMLLCNFIRDCRKKAG